MTAGADAGGWSETGAFWSDELEELHEESSRDHFLDVWNRRAIIERLGTTGNAPTILDAGCSTGYLLEDLRAALPNACLAGLDYLFAGLPLAARNVPESAFIQADVCVLPFADASVDVIVSVNLLEHVPDDVQALREFRRTLRPGGRAVIVVPASPGLYDYYDRFLHHQRRYGRGELPGKARQAGFEVVEDLRIGSLIYPRVLPREKAQSAHANHLEGAELAAQVSRDIAATTNPGVGRLLVAAERALLNVGVRLPFGIRELIVLRRPS